MAPSVQAEKWDMATPYPAQNFHTKNIMKFVADIKGATSGAIDITVHPAASLIKHPEIKNAVRKGNIQMGEFLLSRLSNENPVFEVDFVPFLAIGYDQARKLWKASKPIVDKLLDRQNLKVLYAVAWPSQGFYTKKKINTVEDFKGLKFRAQTETVEKLARIMGMVPTQIELPETPQAFSTGRIEAIISSPTTGANMKIWDYVNYFYNVESCNPKNVVVINKKVWRKLDPKTKKILLEASARAEDRGWKMSAAEADEKIEIMRKGGLKIINATGEFKKGLLKVGDKMIAGWLKRAGADGKAIMDAMKKLNK
jgi:TRAP-type C4-dicarboxylate transport system substrate-binding protein